MITPNPKETSIEDSNKKVSASIHTQKIGNLCENPKIKLLAKPEKLNFLDIIKSKAFEIEGKEGISKKLNLIVIGIASFLILIGFCENFFSNFIGVFYPLFGSLKALETDIIEEDKMWLTYWTVFSLYFAIEMIFGFLLKKIPLYFLFKIAFFVYLYLPQTRGAELIYKKLIKSTFIKCERNVDKLLNDLQYDTKNISKNAKDLFDKQSSEVFNIFNSSKNEEETTPKDPVIKKNQ
jgi:receptor expression-enhancing protein 5/6